MWFLCPELGVLFVPSTPEGQISSWPLLPVVPVVLIILAFSFFGDGLRDAADPYK